MGTDTRGDSRLITYDEAKPRPSNALVQNWIRFNGPYDNATTKDTSIALDKNKFKIKKIWELSKGEGYASPAIFNNHLILFHLQNGFEIIESRDAETGKNPLESQNIQLNIVIDMDIPMVLEQVRLSGTDVYMLTE